MSEYRSTECPFCSLPAQRAFEGNAYALAVADAFPVSAGHTLIVPRRHVADFFELTEAEVVAVHELLRRARGRLERALSPGGYNIGVNVGGVAGQTVFHAHVHLIPRYPGDLADPTGGVRNVIPGRGRYDRPA